MTLIETDRLLLRAPASDDLDEFAALHRDPEVTRFVHALDRAQAAERLRANAREWDERGCGFWAVVERARGRFLGRVGFKYWPQFTETELGWVLRRDAWGCGYATEAGRACLDWGFAALPVAYFTAMINADNARSTAVARRLGFRVLREDSLLGDPVIVHAIARGAHAGLDRSRA
jgi:RimJ/RimL family protein N-acetyltransferase